MSSGTRRIGALFTAAIVIGLMLPASVVAAEPTTTSLRGPTSVPGWYEPIHLLAIVRPTPDESGDVTLSRDGAAVATAETSPNGAANFTVPGLAPGTYTFVATFAGTADSLPSTSDPTDVTTIDDRTPITITVESGANPSLRGDSVPFTVVVDPVPDTGQVSVSHGGNATSEPLDPSGTNVIDHPMGVAGTFTVNACFGGSTEYQDTCTTVGIEQQVVAYDTTTTLSIEPTSLYIDEGLVIDVQVDPPPDVAGSVIVRRMWDPALWTIPLDPVTGAGELEVSGADVASRLRWGDNVLIAQYGGSDHMNPSDSDIVTVLGKRDATTLDIDVESDTIAIGGSVTATAAVVPAPSEGTFLDVYLRGGPNETFVSGSAETNADGAATANVTAPSNWPVGEYELEFTFHGDIRLVPSQASVPVTIDDPDTIPPTGTVTIAGGAANTKTTAVTLTVPASDSGSGPSQVALSNDGANWTTRPYASSQAWTLPTTNGTRTVYAKWKDAAGNWSAVKTDTIVLDTVAPTVTEPRRGFAPGTAISSGRISLWVPWSGTDATSGIARYELAQSTDGGAWTTISTTLTSPAASRMLETERTYAFRARAVDNAGNVGSWATGETFRISRYSEYNQAISYSGPWSTVSNPAYWGGGVKTSSTAGATASITFTGRSIAWVARTGPDRGQADIYVNGAKVATVDLYSVSPGAQRVVWVGSWTTAISRKVTIRVAGTTGRPRIDLDALVTAN